MSDFTFSCPQCKQQLETAEETAGQLVECPMCKNTIEIPYPQRPPALRPVSATPKEVPQCKSPVLFRLLTRLLWWWRTRSVSARAISMFGTLVFLAIGVFCFTHGSVKEGLANLGAAVIFLLTAPIGWAIGDRFRQYAMPSFYFANGALDLAEKRFFWTNGPQLIGVGIVAGVLASLVTTVSESETKKPLPGVETSPHTSAVPDNHRLSNLQEQLKHLEVEKQQKLNLVESDLDMELKNLNRDIEDLKQSVTAGQQKLVALRAAYDPLATQLNPLQGQRDAIQTKYEKQISDAELQIENTKAARDTFKAEALMAAAKLINDAIVSADLKVDLLPKDGMFPDDRLRFRCDLSNTVFANSRPPCIEVKDQVFVNDARGARWVPHSPELQIHQQLQREYGRNGRSNVGLAIVARVRPGENNWTVGEVIIFDRLPTVLMGTSTAAAFLNAFTTYTNQLNTYERAITNNLPASLRNELRLSLQKWDYQNGDRLESLRQQVLPLAEQIKVTEQELLGFNSQLIEKTALIGKPRDAVIAEKREKITTAFEERGNALRAEIASAQAETRQ